MKVLYGDRNLTMKKTHSKRKKAGSTRSKGKSLGESEIEVCDICAFEDSINFRMC